MKSGPSVRGIVGSWNSRLINDIYYTPPWATEALLKLEPFVGVVWEPACGRGDIAKVCEMRGLCTIQTDISSGHDFLSDAPLEGIENIITNPPYRYALEFAKRAREIAFSKVALLLKLVFLEGKSRYAFFQEVNFPLARVYVFSRRIQFSHLGDAAGSPTLASAWFVWDKKHKQRPEIRWIE